MLMLENMKVICFVADMLRYILLSESMKIAHRLLSGVAKIKLSLESIRLTRGCGTQCCREVVGHSVVIRRQGIASIDMRLDHIEANKNKTPLGNLFSSC